MNHAIFISYRRKDTLTEARAVYERLRAEFGSSRVFIDLEGLDFGVDFAEVLDQQLKNCKIMLALIGSKWIEIDPNDGAKRIDDEYDFVRTEIRAALSRNIRVIPVLLDGASMPHSRDLPEDIRGLLRRHYFELDFHRFDSDVGRLITTLRRIVDESSSSVIKSAEKEFTPQSTQASESQISPNGASSIVADSKPPNPLSSNKTEFDRDLSSTGNPPQQAITGFNSVLNDTPVTRTRPAITLIGLPKHPALYVIATLLSIISIVVASSNYSGSPDPNSGAAAKAPSVALAPTTAPAPVYVAEGVIRIGHVGPTSGALAHLGKDNENGARMAIEELNAANLTIGRQPVKFELLAEDDAADPKKGAAAAQKLVDAKVNGVIGHLNSGTTIPASQIYNDAGIPQISPSATNPKYTRQGYSGAFRLIADDLQLGFKLGKYAVEALKGRNIAVIDDRSAYGSGLVDAFESGVTFGGSTIVGREFTSDRATDFNVILTTLKAKKPDIIFFGGMDAVAGPMLKQMKQLGIKAKFMGGDGICSSGLVDLAGDGMSDEQVYCAEAGGVEDKDQAGMKKFRAAFIARFNTDVQVYAPYTYDAVMVVVKAMIAADSSEPAKYLPKLKAINHKGVTGKIAFDEKGDIKNGNLTMYTYRSGRREAFAVIN